MFCARACERESCIRNNTHNGGYKCTRVLAHACAQVLVCVPSERERGREGEREKEKGKQRESGCESESERERERLC